MIMTTTASSTSSYTMSPTPSPSLSSSRPFTPVPAGSCLAGRHVIYRGLTKSSMEYMSLTHSRHTEAAHMIKGEILISGQRSGYIQYNIVLDHEWMTRKVKMSASFGGQEKRLVLEVDQDQRWYKVTEHRLARARSFFRAGHAHQASLSDSSNADSAGQMTPSHTADTRQGKDGSQSHCSMQDADAHLSDSTSCYSSSSDSECSISFEKINLTWTPPPKNSKRLSKRFSSSNPLGTKTSPPTSSSSNCTARNDTSTPTPSSPASVDTTPRASSSAQSPSVAFEAKNLIKSISTSSLAGPKKYEHLPHLDGCIHLDLGHEISPSTLLFPLQRATLGVDPSCMSEHLASLSSEASLTEKSALVSFPELELTPVETHIAFAGPGHRENFSLVECWRDEEKAMLVEVDGDGLATRYGRLWARIPSS